MGDLVEIKFEFDDSNKTVGKYLVFDVETTGLPINRNASPNEFHNWPYIVQIAWLLFDDEFKLIEHNSSYVKQPVEIPTEATKIHGITTQMMHEKGADPPTVFASFKKALTNTKYLIAHNIDFDLPIAQCDFLRNGIVWDFQSNNTFCTMKSSTIFCGIPKRNGGYKWPTLVELYQRCFFPGQTMTIRQDINPTNNLHNAIIDAAMTAQCFFKLKEFGLFHDFDPLAEDNTDNLHVIYPKYESDNGRWWCTKIEHLGLGTSCVIKDEWNPVYNTYSDKILAQFRKWDEQWAKKKFKAQKETNQKVAEEQTLKAQEEQKLITDLIINSFRIGNTINWESFKDTTIFSKPNPKDDLESILSRMSPIHAPSYKELPKEPDKELYTPQVTLIERIFSSLKEKKIKEAEKRYNIAKNDWEKVCDEINSSNLILKEQYEQNQNEFEHKKQDLIKRYDELEINWKQENENFFIKQNEHNDNIDKLKNEYLNKIPVAITRYCDIILNNSNYPESFPKSFNIDYFSDSRLLIIDYNLPTPSDLPKVAEVKFIASRNELKETYLSEAQQSKLYNSTIYKITLRTLSEVFEADKAEALEEIVFNGWVKAISKATGKIENTCIVSIKVKKKDFEEIELINVDPKVCFKNLKGNGSTNLRDIKAVQPIFIHKD